ncbi:1,4-dihydroxy-2-naphthoate octaprenyltransferase [Chryseolinea serpens]|uniref:1,4-dihydroxy-2-naphthoate octaprenyltransferase n=1 Tax=Chryseolinea serpens TaxID=947013 RepID=A0A1M5XL98_9BACT|nr:UbiA family prenyltransferase [Chryseolinea serpens]SHI00442.1 1,4-dihydroxy-2-naphthoate octaprenyltransferase [Chryseolinea serpens]
MLSLSSWLHMRIPFSYFLMPVFLFTLAISPNNSMYEPVFWTFIIVHLLLYPASNGYNSYFDKDEKSIGGLKNPPPVNKGLYSLALFFDALAIGLGWLMINFTFAIMLLIYGLVSKAYSHPAVRLKKYPIGGWLVAGIFQGFFTFIMCYVGINKFSLETAWQWPVLIPAALSTLMLWGNYPMTQIYQHDEDGRRGDKTLSLLLGIRGTFYFVGAVFGMVTLAFVVYFNAYFSSRQAIAFLIALSPVVLYFLYWFAQAYRDETKADYQHTMWLNFISATCLNAFFLYLTFSAMKFI